MQLVKKLTRVLSFVPLSELARKLTLFSIVVVLSPSAYGEKLVGTPCAHKLAVSSMVEEVRARQEKARGTPHGDINVSEIVRKYIPVDCELSRIVIDVTNAGFKLSNSRKGAPSTIDASILLTKNWWSFSSVEFLLEIQHALGRVKMLTGTIVYYNL